MNHRTLLALIPRRIAHHAIFQLVLAWVRRAGHFSLSSETQNGAIQVGLSFDAGDDWRTGLVAAMIAAANDAATARERGVRIAIEDRGMDKPGEAYALVALYPYLSELAFVSDSGSAAPAQPRETIARQQSVFERNADVNGWAHAAIKTACPDAAAVAVDARDYAAAVRPDGPLFLPDGRLRVWIVGDPSGLPGSNEIDPRFAVLRRVGCDLLEELAMVRAVDAFVGRSSHYSLFAADAGVPVISPTAGTADILPFLGATEQWK